MASVAQAAGPLLSHRRRFQTAVHGAQVGPRGTFGHPPHRLLLGHLFFQLFEQRVLDRKNFRLNKFSFQFEIP
jgi:hypothetical protein